jgi:hypothetical protein
MTLKTINFLAIALLTMLLLNVGGCGSGTGVKKEEETKKSLEPQTKQLEELQVKRENRLKQLKEMDINLLAQELSIESERGMEPFNATSFAEMVSRSENDAAVLGKLLTESNRKSLLGVLALRKMNPAAYSSLKSEFKVGVLVDALKTSKYFNTWGLPHLYWEDAAKAIIEEGKTAKKPLIALLNDTRDAPMWGSDEVLEYKAYKYRVCDYAWALLNAINGTKAEIPADIGARDKLIAAIKR